MWASEEEQEACRPQRWLVSRVQVRAHHDAAFKFHMQRRAETAGPGAEHRRKIFGFDIAATSLVFWGGTNTEHIHFMQSLRTHARQKGILKKLSGQLSGAPSPPLKGRSAGALITTPYILLYA